MDEDTVTIPTVDESEQGAPTVTDEAAPYGYKKDGTPYKRDPARYEKAERTKSRRTTRRRTSKGPDFRNDVKGLLQIVGVPLVVLGTRNDAFLADAVALEMSTPEIAEAVNEVALADERVAAVLVKLGKVGPYGLLVAALTPLIAQSMANHGVIAAGLAGTVDPDALVATVRAQMAQEAAAAGSGPNGAAAPSRASAGS